MYYPLPEADPSAANAFAAVGGIRSVSARTARSVVRIAAERGVDADELLAAVGVDPAALADPDARISGDLMAVLWSTAAEMTRDVDFGLHVGRDTQPSELSVMGYLLMSAGTLGEVLDCATQYVAVHTEGVRTVLDVGDSGRPTTYTIDVEGGSEAPVRQAPRHQMECSMASMVTGMAAFAGRALPVLSVEFAHLKPTSGSETHREVFGVEPTFDAPEYRVVLDTAVLSWPVRTANAHVFNAVQTEVDRLMSQLCGDVYSRAVSAIAQCFQEECLPTLALVARDLAVGERTLQRCLKAKGVTFRQAVDDVRNDVACRRLVREQNTIHEVAFVLGFASPSAFHRAFKRWTGQTPKAYQEEVQGMHGGGSWLVASA